jgi:hypothetical protein
MMSVPRYSAMEVERLLAGVGRLVLSNLATPTVRGDDEYTAMVWSLLFLADSCDERGVIREPDVEEVDRNVRAWMRNRLVCPKYVEEEAMSSLVAYVMQFELPQSHERFLEEIRNHDVPLFWLHCVNCSANYSHRQFPVWGNHCQQHN